MSISSTERTAFGYCSLFLFYKETIKMADLKTPDNLKYTESDEWVLIEGDVATIGLTDYAQDALNDIVYVELPEEGDEFDAEDAFGSVESVKAASDLITPVAGTVKAINSELEDEPELINADPYGKGWLVKLDVDDPDVSELMDAAAYKAYCEERKS